MSEKIEVKINDVSVEVSAKDLIGMLKGKIYELELQIERYKDLFLEGNQEILHLKEMLDKKQCDDMAGQDVQVEVRKTDFQIGDKEVTRVSQNN